MANQEPITVQRIVREETCLTSSNFHCQRMDYHDVHCYDCHAWYLNYGADNQGPINVSPRYTEREDDAVRKQAGTD